MGILGKEIKVETESKPPKRKRLFQPVRLANGPARPYIMV
jgi:hypothetical protein